MERKDLQLGREVNLRTSTRSGTERTTGAKLRMLSFHCHDSVADVLRGLRWSRDDGDGWFGFMDDGLKLIEVAHSNSRGKRHVLANKSRVSVKEANDSEPSRGKSAVVRQGATKVPDTDDDDRPVLRQSELTSDLVDEELDVVAHPRVPYDPR